jgi:hypothetical protein
LLTTIISSGRATQGLTLRCIGFVIRHGTKTAPTSWIGATVQVRRVASCNTIKWSNDDDDDKDDDKDDDEDDDDSNNDGNEMAMVA